MTLSNIERIINDLKVIKERKEMFLPENLRPHFNEIIPKRRAILLYGPRGVGKTTYLLNAIKGKNIFYVSLDSPFVSAIPLFELGNAIFMAGYKGIVFDEVHFGNKWSLHLKALYDSFPDKIIWVSDSSSIVLRRGIGDLSRRFSKIHMPFLSLREYIYLREGVEFQKINPFEYKLEEVKKILKTVDIMRLFNDYLKEGFRPIFLEGDYGEQVLNIIGKSIHYDIPFYISSISDNHLRLMNAIIGFLASSDIPTINVERMCKEWGIGKVKLYELLYVMNETELIEIVYRKGDKKAYSKGAKIFLADPSIYNVLEGSIGTMREAFVFRSLKEMKKNVFSCKDERDCDFTCDGLKIEVGGKNKKIKRADYVIRDDVDIPALNIIPMWLLGMGW